MPDTVGVYDNSGGGTKPIHAEPALSQKADGTPLEQQVIQIEARRGIAQIIELLTSIDNRLAALEEAQVGFSS